MLVYINIKFCSCFIFLIVIVLSILVRIISIVKY